MRRTKRKDWRLVLVTICFNAPAASVHRGHRAFRLSIRAYVCLWQSVHPSLTRLTFLSKVESQDLLMVASWYFIWGYISLRPAGLYKSHDLIPTFYGPLTSDFGQIIKVNIFIQSKISRSINCSKSIFHMRMYLWDQQEYTRAMTSWPIFHGPLTLDFGQIIEVNIFVQGRISRPINGSKLIFHMRMYLYEPSRNIQEPWPHDLYFTVH